MAIHQGVPFKPPEAYYPKDMGQTLAKEIQFFYYFVAASQIFNLDHITNVSYRMLSYTVSIREHC